METINHLYEQTDKYQSVTSEEIVSNLSTYNITEIELKKEEILRFQEDILKDIYTTETNPFLIGKQGNVLYINPDYYLKNKEQVEELLTKIISSTQEKSFVIDSNALITKNILKSISSNPNLEEIELARYAQENYLLTEEDYNILKQSNLKKIKTSGVSEELKDNFDSLISYNVDRFLISYNKYSDLSKEQIYLNEKITKEDIENLKYLTNNKTKIIIKEENIEDAIVITTRLKELGKENHVVIDINNKELVTPKILSNANYLNGYTDIRIGLDIIPIKEYLRLEKILYQMVEPACNLSSFERYIYAYNVVKQYKQYKENEKNKSASRNLYAILENEYMVCVGYSHMLEDLLNKSGIKSIYRSTGVDDSYDKKDEKEVVNINWNGHARRFVYINDPKYGIDGFYVADPTWDNDLKNDLYNHLLLTNEEETETKRYNFLPTSVSSSSIELMNIQSIEEFYQKINFYLDRNPESNLKDLISNSIDDIRKLDNNFIKKLEEKYPEIQDFFNPWPNEKEILYEIGEYLLTKVNKPVSGQTIMSAVSEVYQKAYHLEGEELQNKLKETIEINNHRQHIKFPKREKIDEYGNKIELPGISNKFNIDTNTYHK